LWLDIGYTCRLTDVCRLLRSGLTEWGFARPNDFNAPIGHVEYPSAKLGNRNAIVILGKVVDELDVMKKKIRAVRHGEMRRNGEPIMFSCVTHEYLSSSR